KLSSLCSHIWLSVAVGNTRSKTKVLDSFTRVAWSLEENGVLASWSTLGELIEGDDLTAGLQNSGTSTLGDRKSGDGQFGNVEETHIVGDGANNNGDLFLASFAAHLVSL